MRGRGLTTAALAFGAVLIFSGMAAAADAPKQVTFSKDVAPIFQAKCQECHQPNSIAPMSLITFQEARPWARSIKERVATRQMPPWHIDRASASRSSRTTCRSPTSRSTRSSLGRPGRAAGRSEGHAAAQAARSPTTSWQGVKDGYGPPDLVDQVAGVHDAGASTRTSGGGR